MNILDTIIAHKITEVAAAKEAVSLHELMQKPLFERQTLSLKQFLDDKSKTGIIAEFKRRSPSKGVINDTASLQSVTAAYVAHGASAISVLTDNHFFGGTLDDLQAARVNEVPLLRKDFMVDEYQVAEAKAYGADVILLIAACLTPQRVQQLAAHAKAYGLEVLLELHSEAELAHICDEVDVIGINNRNLKSFEVDIDTSIRLLHRLPEQKPAIAESGISNTDTMLTLQRAGFRGYLIGENFMKQPDPSIAFAAFVHQLKQKQHAH